ncbi:MAG: hypothetical protein V2J10_06215, partial [Wenzhouxiangella sp.]|nr:hypothetical protein [Wenzhouxiangella sp.]
MASSFDHSNHHPADYRQGDDGLGPLAERIRRWGLELGFDQIGIADIDLADYETRLEAWLDAGNHGEMGWMAQHGRKRSRPALLRPGTRSVI